MAKAKKLRASQTPVYGHVCGELGVHDDVLVDLSERLDDQSGWMLSRLGLDTTTPVPELTQEELSARLAEDRKKQEYRREPCYQIRRHAIHKDGEYDFGAIHVVEDEEGQVRKVTRSSPNGRYVELSNQVVID
jgi:hypothetical protein